MTPGSGAQYQDRGNQTAIGAMTFTYDGESRMATSVLNGETTTYLYDGDGRRVQKVSAAGTTTYAYDVTGNLAAEYGGTITAPCSTCYLSVDHLGSTRALTDGTTGAVKERHDYLPFGDEIFAGIGGRTMAQGYLNPTTAQGVMFTGQYRDGELSGSSMPSGLDYFGARYFSGAQGRFTSPDQPFVDQWETKPQSWNLYAYGRNNPLRFADPTGQKCIDTSNGPAHDGTGGGCPAAGVDPNGNIQPQQVNVNAKGGNALVAFGINAGFALSNVANDYFAWMFQQRPDVLQNTPTSRAFVGQAAAATVMVGTALIGPGR